MCSLIARSQMTSTLFPYTTLFRSENGKERTFRCSFNLKSLKYDNRASYYLVIADETGLQMPQKEEIQIDIAFAVDEFDFLDRKSTRLNSSHVSNSYAVFCLKNKTE